MSFIDFESSQDLKSKRDDEKEMRARILVKVKNKHLAQEWNIEQAKKKGEDVWMLPSVSNKIDSKSGKHKKKKKRKHASSDNDSTEETKKEVVAIETNSNESVKRDQWMEMTSLFKTYSKDEIQIRDGTSRKLKALEEKKRKEEANKPGSHARELNPFFKDGGSGIPETAVKPSFCDANWLIKALERAKSQAKDEGRTLQEVAKDRWGSLETFYKLLEEAENQSKHLPTHEKVRETERNQFKPADERWKRKDTSSRNRDRRSSSRDRHKRRSSSRDRIRRKMRCKRSSSSDGDSRSRYLNKDCHKKRSKNKFRSSSRSSSSEEDHKRRRKQRRRSCSSSSDSCSTYRRPKEKTVPMLRPASDYEEVDLNGKHASSTVSRNSYTRSSCNWKKKSADQNAPIVTDVKPSLVVPHKEVPLSSPPRIKDVMSVSDEEDSQPKKITKILTDKELNKLAAKLTKAELLDNQSLVDKLKKKLIKARSDREDSGKEMNSIVNTEEVVVLTRTDASGFIRPAASTHGAPRDKKSRKKNAVTHGADGQRDRYFADDDNYDLKTMFEREKLTSADDQIAMFHKEACSNTEKLSDDFDVDDMFMAKLAPKRDLEKEQERDRKMAIAEHQRTQKSLESCHRCIDSKLMKKHLILSLGVKCYLSVPYHESLTEGHCLISPLQHVACSTRADEDLWEEINKYRQALVRMFESRDEDCVFFETAVNVKNHPHMVIECVPLPKEIGEVAPIYFKKAIMECEEEWAQNKKLIDLKGRNIRKAVPVGLPYFAVDFGMCPGYAHVIENEITFGKTFAQEIVGGMLDIDACHFRRPKPENFDKQRSKVMELAKLFEPFDIS